MITAQKFQTAKAQIDFSNMTSREWNHLYHVAFEFLTHVGLSDMLTPEEVSQVLESDTFTHWPSFERNAFFAGLPQEGDDYTEDEYWRDKAAIEGISLT